jgi:hypothetical protein
MEPTPPVAPETSTDSPGWETARELLADGRLADRERLGRPPEVQVLRHGHEVLDLAQLHVCTVPRRVSAGP